jgi:hypothetical protein
MEGPRPLSTRHVHLQRQIYERNICLGHWQCPFQWRAVAVGFFLGEEDRKTDEKLEGAALLSLLGADQKTGQIETGFVAGWAVVKLSAAPSPNCLPNHLCGRAWGRHSPIRQSHAFQLRKGNVKAREDRGNNLARAAAAAGSRPPRANWRAQVVVAATAKEALGRPPRGLPGAHSRCFRLKAAAGCGLA